MNLPRSSGILLHPTSLPSRYGIGDLGTSAYEFVDYLVSCRQTLWQILPLGPTGYADSPYQCFSAFAGNPLLISPERLVRDGYLSDSALSAVPAFPRYEVDYGWVLYYKNKLHQEAHENFRQNGTAVQKEAFAQFCTDQAYWLDDFALFMALKLHHMTDEDGGVWSTWPAELVHRQPEAMSAWSEKLADDIERHKFLQFIFFQQWLELRAYANEKGVKIIGDAPIFVAYDSADVWANPDLFYLDAAGKQTVVAGVPPDYFSETGQRWGNPLYRWDVMAQTDYAWWESRLKMIFTQVDIVRLDHFRGFEAYWEIPADEETAVIGRWVQGPSSKFFRAMQEKLQDLPIIAEDLGLITRGVVDLREEFNLPGMKILQFAFGGERNNSFLPHTFDKDCIVYTGTHDNETTVGWYENATPDEQDHFRRYVSRDGHDVAWDMIRLAFMSVASAAIIPMQDLLKLGNQARMNFPGKASGYWKWRFTPEMLTPDIPHRLGEMTALYGRLPEQQTDPEYQEIEIEAP